MSVTPSKFHAKFSPLSFVFLLAGLICGSSAWAAVPAVVIDAQQAVGSGYGHPQSIAVSKNGTIYIADTDNNQIVALTGDLPYPGTSNPVSTAPYTLTSPQALAFDANGNLYLGDTPSAGGRIIELVGDGAGGLTGTTKLIFSGAPLNNPIALTFDSTGTLFIGDYVPTDEFTGVGQIFTLASGGSTLTVLSTGLPSTLIPAAFAIDSSKHLYIADNGSMSNSVFVVPDTGGTAQLVQTQSFVINQPSGLALDQAGNLFILALLGNASTGQQVVEVPAASPSTPYILPNTGIGTSSSMAFDPAGNLDIVDSQDGVVFQLTYVNPTYLGVQAVGQVGPPVVFNFEFNQPTTLNGFRILSQGDVSTEVTRTAGGNCVNGVHDNLPGGGPAVSPYYPYTCDVFYEGTPSYPGNRSSAILVRGAAGAILGSTPVYQFALGGAEVTYPLNSSITATNLQQPQAIAISGLNRLVYIADTQAGKVYSTNGLGGTTLTPVSTGAVSLSAPSALALDGAGNLFIADFNDGDVIEVPTTTGVAPSVVNTGGLLQHPIALAVDSIGNMYIGDAGSGGINAGSGNPGYIVKLPAGGAAFKMTIPSVSIVFPQALATDPYINSLLIGDGGDPSGAGQVVELSADGKTATVISLSDVTNPTGVAFDADTDMYVLDGLANTVTMIPAASTGFPPFLLPFDNSTLSSASALAISAGGQSLLIGNIGSGNSNNVVHVNGNRSTLSFGSVNTGSTSPTKSALELNIGNADLTLANPWYSVNTPNTAFNLGASDCANNLVLPPSNACSINVTFSPTAIGHTTQQITVDSSAYNSGIPILTIQGTGTVPGSVKPGKGR